MRKYVAEIAMGGDPTEERRRRTTLADLAAMWEAKEAHHLKPATQYAYRLALRAHILPKLGKGSLDRISISALRSFPMISSALCRFLPIRPAPCSIRRYKPDRYQGGRSFVLSGTYVAAHRRHGLMMLIGDRSSDLLDFERVHLEKTHEFSLAAG